MVQLVYKEARAQLVILDYKEPREQLVILVILDWLEAKGRQVVRGQPVLRVHKEKLVILEGRVLLVILV